MLKLARELFLTYEYVKEINRVDKGGCWSVFSLASACNPAGAATH